MKTLIGVNITSPYQIISFFIFFKRHRSIYKHAIIYKHDYWGVNQIYLQYIDLIKREGVEIIEGVVTTRDIYFDFKKRYEYCEDRRSEKFSFVFINHPHPVYRFFFPRSDFIVIADGYGTYGNCKSYLLSVLREKRIGVHYFFVGKLLIKYLIKKVLISLLSYQKYMLVDSCTLEVNDDFRNDFFEFFQNIPIPIDVYLDKPTLIFVSQPLVKLGILKHHEYSETLSKIENIAKSMGLEFVIKKHPSDVESSHENYNFSGIIEHACCLDENIKCIVSFNSSALISIPVLSDIQCMKIDISNNYMSSKQRRLLANIQDLSNISF